MVAATSRETTPAELFKPAQPPFFVTEYPELKSIIAINRDITQMSGDPAVVQNESNLEYVVEAIKYKYEDKSDAIFLKAAYLLFPQSKRL